MSKRQLIREPIIQEVYDDNFLIEMKKINKIIEKFPYVSMVKLKLT